MKTLTGTDTVLAAKLLKEGKLVAMPTETVYGLAANALNEEAVLDIFKVKGRPAFDPLIVHIPDAGSLKKYASHIPESAQKLADRFWPGPLTLVLPKMDCIPDIVSSGLSTVGLRMPSHPMALELLRSIDFPLAAPSANPFGYISPTTASHVFEQLHEKIPYILDGGSSRVGVESTIVGFEDNIAVVYRLGGISIEQLREVLPDLKLQISSSSDPKAPGMLHLHYAPRKKILLGDIQNLILLNKDKKISVISFCNRYDHPCIVQQAVLSVTGNVDEAASNLFSAMRMADQSSADLIIAELVPESGLGRAINDRLKRAAGLG